MIDSLVLIYHDDYDDVKRLIIINKPLYFIMTAVRAYYYSTILIIINFNLIIFSSWLWTIKIERKKKTRELFHAKYICVVSCYVSFFSLSG